MFYSVGIEREEKGIMADFSPVNLNLFKQRDYVTKPSEGTSPQNEEMIIWDSPIKGKSPILESTDNQTKTKTLNQICGSSPKKFSLGFEDEIKKFDFSPDNIAPDINPETSKSTESTDFPVNRTTITPDALKQKSSDESANDDANSVAVREKAVNYQRHETIADDKQVFLKKTQKHNRKHHDKAEKSHTDHKSGEAHNNRQSSAVPVKVERTEEKGKSGKAANRTRKEKSADKAANATDKQKPAATGYYPTNADKSRNLKGESNAASFSWDRLRNMPETPKYKPNNKAFTDPATGEKVTLWERFFKPRHTSSETKPQSQTSAKPNASQPIKPQQPSGAQQTESPWGVLDKYKK